MKKFLLSLLLVCGAYAFESLANEVNIESTTRALSGRGDVAYGSFFSIINQDLSPGTSVIFTDSQRKKVEFPSPTNIEIERSGIYTINYNVTGGRGSIDDPVAGTWSVGLFLNGSLVNGSVVGSQTEDGLEVVSMSNSLILKLRRGDVLQLRNTAAVAIFLSAAVSGDSVANVSASLVLQKIDDVRRDCN